MSDTPASAPGEDGARLRLIRKIELICDRTVRGRHATDRWQVRVHRLLRIVSIVLTSLAGAGLITDKVKPELANEVGWPMLIGPWVSLGIGILLQIANELGIEKTALESRSAAESFSWIETSLEIVLVEENPIELVNKLLTEANTMLQKYHAVMPRFSEVSEKEAKELTLNLVGKYGSDWNLPRERRRKGSTS